MIIMIIYDGTIYTYTTIRGYDTTTITMDTTYVPSPPLPPLMVFASPPALLSVRLSALWM